MMDADAVRCAKCGEAIPEEPGLPLEDRMPCPACGSTARAFAKVFHEVVEVHAFVDGKKRAAGLASKKKVRVHLQQGDQLNHETGLWVLKERRIDKDASPAWYFERITDPETGEVIHECSEPLDKHTGHGGAEPSERRGAQNLGEEDQ